eukprot:scaffold309611_cov36-Tisochrysis_lutea.AAC.3
MEAVDQGDQGARGSAYLGDEDQSLDSKTTVRRIGDEGKEQGAEGGAFGKGFSSARASYDRDNCRERFVTMPHPGADRQVRAYACKRWHTPAFVEATEVLGRLGVCDKGNTTGLRDRTTRTNVGVSVERALACESNGSAPEVRVPRLLGCTLTRLVDAASRRRSCKQLRPPRRNQFERSAILSSGAGKGSGASERERECQVSAPKDD